MISLRRRPFSRQGSERFGVLRATANANAKVGPRVSHNET
jgi:hypothetical protein